MYVTVTVVLYYVHLFGCYAVVYLFYVMIYFFGSYLCWKVVLKGAFDRADAAMKIL